MEKLLTTEQVAEVLGVPRATLWQWRSHGKGPKGLRVGRHVRYRATDIDRWIAAQLANERL